MAVTGAAGPATAGGAVWLPESGTSSGRRLTGIMDRTTAQIACNTRPGRTAVSIGYR
jgi:hypothetical protein